MMAASLRKARSVTGGPDPGEGPQVILAVARAIICTAALFKLGWQYPMQCAVVILTFYIMHLDSRVERDPRRKIKFSMEMGVLAAVTAWFLSNAVGLTP